MAKPKNREEARWMAEGAYLSKHMPKDKESRRALRMQRDPDDYRKSAYYSICEKAREAGREAEAAWVEKHQG